MTRFTVNTIIRRFEKGGLLYLEGRKGRNTCVVLNEKGEMYLEDTGQKIIEMENRIFMGWGEEEKAIFQLNQKYASELKMEVDKMENRQENE